MRKLKKIFVSVLCLLALSCGAIGMIACDGISISPNGNGGVVVGPAGGSDPSDDRQNSNDTEGNSSVGDDQISHQHLWSGSSVTKKPTCEEKGERTYVCLLCDKKVVEELDILGHDLIKHTAKAATCTEIGWEEYECCDREGCEYTTYEEIALVDHETVEYAAQAATCTENGWKEHVACKNCDYTTYEEIEALGHDKVRYAAKSATCTESGYEPYEVCEREGCSYTTYKEIPVLNHDLTIYEKREATCTEDGWEAYEICNRCDYQTPFVTILATGHAYDNKVCLHCGAAEPDHEHVWDNGLVAKEATCVEKGERIYSCANCEETKTEIIPLNPHNNKSFEEKAATCTEKGWFAYTVCEGCGYSTYTEINALGHSYDKGVATTAATCESAGVMTYTCLCGDTYTKAIAAKGHVYGAWSVSKAATCEDEGEEIRVCSNDTSHTEIRAIKSLGHNYGEWVEMQEPTCAVEGIEERVCKNDLSHVETRSISKTTEHNVGENGKCLVCNKLINNQLKTPVISFEDETSIGWSMIANAEAYLVYILPNNETVEVGQPEISLEPYFAGNKTLRIQVKAVAGEGSEYVDSEYCELYVYTIQGETIVGTKGVGDAVNLLTGGYTEFADGTTSIFDETLFNRLRLVEDASVKKQQTVVTYEEDLDSYLDKITASANNKTSISASVAYAGIAKATMGYEFEVGEKYERSTYSQTQAVFYDMDYYYINKQTEIYGYNDIEKLSSILSASFLADAQAVADNKMTPAEFIGKYGTHILTAGIYGAKFNAHYELLTNKDTAENMFGTSIKSTITAGISGSLYGVELGVDVSNTTEVSNEHFVSETNENKQSKFTATAIGGSAQGINATTLAEVAAASAKWAAGLDDTNCVLIDVPDNSLFFVWDFLGEEYQETKDALSEYFYSQCDASYYALKDKLSSLYSESVTFDEERGILTVNFAGLHAYEKASLEGVSYTKENNGVDFDGKTMVLYSAINDVPVQKIVFKGNYYKADRYGQLRTNYFENLTIKFDQWWSQDILLELDSFAYEASAGVSALDFSAVSSNNITINVIGRSYVKGGDGAKAGAKGCLGISADGKSLTITGIGTLSVIGGSGISATATGGAGGTGGTAVSVKNLTVNMEGDLTFTGGNGGHGKTGAKGANGSVSNSYTEIDKWYGFLGAHIATIYRYNQATEGGTGGTGGNGGSGGLPINCEAVVVDANNEGRVEFNYGNGGNGGNGGAGGDGGNGHDYYGYNSSGSFIFAYEPGKGGNSGNGGRGGNAGRSIAGEILKFEGVTVNSGTDGAVGKGGAPGAVGVGGAGGSVSATGNSHSAEKAANGTEGQYGANGA